MEKKLQASLLLTSLLRPLLRYSLKSSLKVHDLEKLVRKILVEEARDTIEEAGGLVSISKISIVTGLHRGEVGRLLAGETRPKDKHDLLQRITGLWTQGQKYKLKDSNKPRPLSYQGLDSEFAELVSTISKEVSHYPILFELERIGAIEYLDEHVSLKVVEYIPLRNVEHGLGVLSDDVESLIETVEANITSEAERPNLHLRTMFDNIDPANLDEIRKWILARGASFHTQIREYLATFDRDVNPKLPKGNTRARITVSSFAHGAVIAKVKQLKPKKRGRKKLTKKEENDQ